MDYCYVAVPIRSQAFLVERRLKLEEINCEITYMPRELMTDLCSMGVRFDSQLLNRVLDVLRRSGIPSLKLYQEVKKPTHIEYLPIDFYYN